MSNIGRYAALVVLVNHRPYSRVFFRSYLRYSRRNSNQMPPKAKSNVGLSKVMFQTDHGLANLANSVWLLWRSCRDDVIKTVVHAIGRMCRSSGAVVVEHSESRCSRFRNLLSGKVLLIKVKLRSSSFVRGAFVVQVNPIKFEECGGTWRMFKMPQSDWLDLKNTSAPGIT